MVRNKKNCAAQNRGLSGALLIGAFCYDKRRQIHIITAPGYTACVYACVASVNQRLVARSLVSANHWLKSIRTNTLL